MSTYCLSAVAYLLILAPELWLLLLASGYWGFFVGAEWLKQERWRW